MKLFTKKTDDSRNNSHSIRALLFAQGLGGALDYFCTFSAFSVLSEA